MNYETLFAIEQRVRVKGAKIKGVVVGIGISGAEAISYRVEYFNGDDLKEWSFSEWQLEAEPPAEKAGF